MLTPPPWHFAGEVIMVDVRVDPDRARQFLPDELSLGSDPGAAAFVFAEWNWCSEDGAELTEPRSSRFAEFLVLLGCEFEGRALARCPYAWVDQPVPMIRGWVQGMPKQFGEIDQTRPKLVGRAGPRPDGEGRHHASISVGGHRLVDLSVTTDGTTVAPPALHNVPLVHTHMSPVWLNGEPDNRSLITSKVTGVEFSPVHSGSAQVKVHQTLDDDFALLQPIDIGSGYVFQYAETLVGGQALTSTPTRGA